MNPLKRELQEIRFYIDNLKDRRRTTCWVIDNTYGKYLAWDFEQVWRWTKHLPHAAKFRTEEHAQIAVDGTTMPLRHRYRILRIPR